MMKNSMTMNHHPLVMIFSAVKAGGQFTRLMMKKVAAPYLTGTTEHHLRIRGTPNSNNFTAVPAAAKAKAMAKTTKATTTEGRTPETLGDPCLDLFFGVKGYAPKSEKYRLLEQLLPAAWSHDPLTTLKLICNIEEFGSDFGESDSESFYRAAVWLHHNHPKTLASNVLSIFGLSYNSVGSTSYNSVGSLYDLGEILRSLTISGNQVSESEDYRLLHDMFSDLFAHHLRSNLEDMNKQVPRSYNDCELNLVPSIERLFGDSIAQKLFLRESYPEYRGLEESLYVHAVRVRLRDEVLAPLDEYIPPVDSDSPEHLQGAAAAAGPLLPYEIVFYAYPYDRDLAQLYWARIVKDVYLKQGKFKNCLVVCNMKAEAPVLHREAVTLSLAVLVSQLSGGPWKGKVISSGPNPELHDLPGSDLDLVSNCDFLKRMDYGTKVDIPKVFDLILQAAAKANLPPDQMVKKVFLVDYDGFHLLAGDSWESDYQAILTKYREKGYGQDAVPQFVHWEVRTKGPLEAPRSQPGLATLTGFSENLFKCFLDNGGQFGPHHVVEVAISGPQYQNLVVID